MKNHLFFIGILLLCSYSSYCQNDQNFFNPISTVAKIPQSPEVAAFEKFSGSVNMYTGVPTISIPIHTFQGKEVSVPISLSYDASGIKVDQIATHVGLGWNLNFGGVVTRNVNGTVDDALNLDGIVDKPITGGIAQGYLDDVLPTGKIHDDHPNEASAFAAKNIYNFYSQNRVDLQPDTFSFNVNGLSGTIVIFYDPNTGPPYSAYCLEHPDYKVSAEYSVSSGLETYISSFKIIDTNGTSYTFAQAEVTHHEHSSEGIGGNLDEYDDGQYILAWYLTEIVTANGLDTFGFTYAFDPWQDKELAMELRQVEIKEVCSTGAKYAEEDRALGLDYYKKDQLYLTSINYNSIEVLTTDRADDRLDLLDVHRISGLNIINMVGQPILNVDFTQTYFQPTNPSSPRERRLKLDEIEIYREASLNDPKLYSFTYFEPHNIPDRKSRSVDFWGYYNGESNAHLAPKLTGNENIANYFNDFTDSFTYTDAPADRTPSLHHTKIGSLISIDFPTGGKSTYEYEQHRNDQNKLVGGLRLRKVTNATNDPISAENKELVTYYFYDDLEQRVDPQNANTIPIPSPTNFPSDYLSSGIAQQDLIFTDVKTVNIGCNGNPDTKKFILTTNRALMAPNNITYSSVSEIRFNAGIFDGCTITKFINEHYDGVIGAIADASPPYVNTNLEYGEIESQKVFDKDFNLLQQTQNDYTTVFLSSTETLMPYTDVGLVMYLNNSNGGILGSNGCERIIDLGGGNYRYTIDEIISGAPCSLDHWNKPRGQGFSIYENAPGYGYQQFWKKFNNSTTTIYENGLAQSQTTTYDYYGTDHFMATEIATTDSKGKKSKTEIAYPPDTSILTGHPNIGDGILSDLVSRNQIATPIQVTQFYEVSVPGPYVEMSQQRRIFDEFTVVNNFNAILPLKVEVSKGSNNLEERMRYFKYDEYGNVTEVSYPNGMKHTYIWGYKGEHLIAEIKNGVYGALATQIQGIIDDSDVEDNQGTEEADLRNALNDLRNESQYADAQISVYTYDPGIGVTSMTDVRGYTTFYYYDQHNRLDYATDEDGNVLSKNEYNLRVNN